MSILPESLSKLAKLAPRKDNLETVKAHTLGWLRRSDLDGAHTVIWEMPSGAMYSCHREGPRCILVRLPGVLRDRYVLVEVL